MAVRRVPSASLAAGARSLKSDSEVTTMHRRFLAAALALLLASPALAAERAKLPTRPKAPKHTTTDSYWGVTVPDDYQYMEHAGDPVAAKWARGQNRYTRAWLDHHPDRKAVLERGVALTHSDSPDYYGGGFSRGPTLFLEGHPPEKQPLLVSPHAG